MGARTRTPALLGVDDACFGTVVLSHASCLIQVVVGSLRIHGSTVSLGVWSGFGKTRIPGFNMAVRHH